MKNSKLWLGSVGLFLCTALTPNLAHADDSLEYSKLGRVVVSAFKCSIFAEESKMEEEQKRMFLTGFQRGKEFIEALKGGKIREQDFKQEVPAYLQMLLGGPSTDFMLGRIYEFSAELAYKDLGNPKDGYSGEVIKTKASQRFSEKGCGDLGK